MCSRFFKGLSFYVFNWISLCSVFHRHKVRVSAFWNQTCMFSASVWEGKILKKQSMVRFVPLFLFVIWTNGNRQKIDLTMVYYFWSVEWFLKWLWKCRININIWETAHLPLPWPNINPNLLFFYCCWVRGGVGVQFLRYWHWLKMSYFPTALTIFLLQTFVFLLKKERNLTSV